MCIPAEGWVLSVVQVVRRRREGAQRRSVERLESGWAGFLESERSLSPSQKQLPLEATEAGRDSPPMARAVAYVGRLSRHVLSRYAMSGKTR